jgi:hypothetical protein
MWGRLPACGGLVGRPFRRLFAACRSAGQPPSLRPVCAGPWTSQRGLGLHAYEREKWTDLTKRAINLTVQIPDPWFMAF